ncbi:hypothetical protein Tco_1155385 [Tanacetum coccineum]
MKLKSMTSQGANVDTSINKGRGPYVFRISAYELLTRTILSFESGMKRLGGQLLTTVTNSPTHGELLRWRVAQEASCFIPSSELLRGGLLRQRFEQVDNITYTAKTSTGLSKILKGYTYECVLIDADKCDVDVVEFLHQVLTHWPQLSIIDAVLAAFGWTVDHESMRHLTIALSSQ